MSDDVKIDLQDEIKLEMNEEIETPVKNEVAVYEEIVKDLAIVTDKTQFNVPVAKVFGAGSLAKTESFGGRSLAQNTELVDKALQNTNELQNIWNRSHSQWTWKHINLHYHGDFKNVRQIAAEMNRKKSALNEAKWKHVKNEIAIKKIEEKLQTEDLDYWKEIDLQIQLAEKREAMANGMVYIEGAMKDVLALNELYEQMKDKFEGFTEDEFEREESKSHLKRSVVQCIRDVRQTGSITKGEQEYLEQIGVNPTKMLYLIREYINKEEAKNDWDVSGLHRFVAGIVDELIDVMKVDKKKMEIMGFNPDPSTMLSYDKPVALKLTHQEEEAPSDDEE
jgi:hypothetical protein